MKTTKRNRRPLNPAQQWKPQLVLVELSGTGGTPSLMTAALSLSEPMFGPIEESGIFLDLGGDIFPAASASLNSTGLVLNLTFEDVTADESGQLVIPPWSPAFRTSQGGYLAPSTTAVTSPA